jgi:hypothetical protein
MADHVIEVGVFGIPTQNGGGLLTTAYEGRRITRTAIALHRWHRTPRHPFCGFNHLTHRESTAIAQVKDIAISPLEQVF